MGLFLELTVKESNSRQFQDGKSDKVRGIAHSPTCGSSSVGVSRVKEQKTSASENVGSAKKYP
eukprot:1979476-Amphidinium_carterae.1